MTHRVLNKHKAKSIIHMACRHKADMSPQSYCGDEEDGRIALSS